MAIIETTTTKLKTKVQGIERKWALPWIDSLRDGRVNEDGVAPKLVDL
jgi:hypothetical protein